MDHLTVTEAAQALGVSVPTVKRYIYDEKLKSVKLPGGQHRIPRSEIDRLLAVGGTGEQREDADDRVQVLERWVTELQEEVERLSGALEVVARYCSQRCDCQDGTRIPADDEAPEAQEPLEVLVLGPGCRKCRALHAATVKVLGELGRGDVPVRHVTSVDEIAQFGPLVTPGLVVDGRVLVSGKIPDENILRRILRESIE